MGLFFSKSLLLTFLFFAFFHSSQANVKYFSIEEISDSIGMPVLNDKQLEIFRTEVNAYRQTLEPLRQTDFKSWTAKMKHLLRRLAEGFKIYNLCRRNPQLDSTINDFESQTNINVYVLAYVQGAFLNNVFERLAEARYDLSREVHIKMKFRFSRDSLSSDTITGKYSVRLQLQYDSALTDTLRKIFDTNYNAYSDLTLEAMVNSELSQAGFTDIRTDGSTAIDLVEPKSKEVLDKLRGVKVSLAASGIFMVQLDNKAIEEGKVYYLAKKDSKLIVKITNNDPNNVKQIKVTMKINAGSAKDKKEITFNITDFTRWSTLDYSPLPDGKYELSCEVEKKTYKISCYIRSEKYEYACTKCGRDLKYTSQKLESMFPKAPIIKKNSSAMAELFNNGFKKMNLSTCLMHAQFLAQCQHESGNFTNKKEEYNYYLLHMLAVFKNNVGCKEWFNQTFWDDKTYLDYVNVHIYEKVDENGKYDMDGEEDEENYKTVMWKDLKNNSIKVPYHYPTGDKYTNKNDTYVENKKATGKYNLLINSREKKVENGERLLNDAYRGVNGNSTDADSEEGFKYRGRGLIQLTGKTNYQDAQDACNKIFSPNPLYDWIGHPEDVEKLDDMVYSAFGWICKNFPNVNILHTLDVSKVTSKVNARSLGLNERKSYFTNLYNNYFFDCPEK